MAKTTDNMHPQLRLSIVMESWLNGQKKQAVEQIDEWGWHHFAETLQQSEVTSDKRNLRMVLELLKISASKHF